MVWPDVAVLGGAVVIDWVADSCGGNDGAYIPCVSVVTEIEIMRLTIRAQF